MSFEIKYYPNAKSKHVKHYGLERPFLELLGGGRIRVRQATELGYVDCCRNGVFDASYTTSKLRRARVSGDGSICGCIMASGNTGYCTFKEYEI